MLKLSQNHKRINPMAAQFCCFSINCGESMNTEEFRPLLKKNLKELLPDNTQSLVSHYSNTRSGAQASVVVQFNDQQAWADWVLCGFNEDRDRTVARALAYWEDKGGALFDGLIEAELENQPGWACNRSYKPERLQTPKHYFRDSEFDHKKKGQYGSWYDGPSDVEGFLKEMKHYMLSLDPRPSGDLDLSNSTSFDTTT